MNNQYYDQGGQRYDNGPVPQYTQPYQYSQPYPQYAAPYAPPAPITRKMPVVALVLAIAAAALYTFDIALQFLNYGFENMYVIELILNMTGYAFVILGIAMYKNGKPLFTGIGAFSMALTYFIYFMDWVGYIGKYVHAAFYVVMHLASIAVFVLVGLHYVLGGKLRGAKNAMSFVYIGITVTKFVYGCMQYFSFEDIFSTVFGYVGYSILLSVAFITFSVKE